MPRNETTQQCETLFADSLRRALDLVQEMKLPMRIQVQIQKPNGRSPDSADRYLRLRSIARSMLDGQIPVIGGHKNATAQEIMTALYQCETLLDQILWMWRQPEAVTPGMIAKAKGASTSTSAKFSREASHALAHRRRR